MVWPVSIKISKAAKAALSFFDRSDDRAQVILVEKPEYGATRVSAYGLDANGFPIPSSQQNSITGLFGAEGAFTDPLPGDFLFSTFGSGNQVIATRGFAVAVPEPASTLLLTLGSICAGAFRRKR